MAATVAAALAGLGAGCGDDDGGDRNPLAWAGAPRVERSPTLPEDHVVSSTVRNGSDEAVDLHARDIVVRDQSGRRLRSSAAFLSGFVYSHVPYNRGRREVPSALPRREQERLGRLVRIPPDGTAPLTVSWRGGDAAQIEYGSGTLPLP